MKSILLVCLGNICRSPMAEAMLIAKLDKRGWSEFFRVDSAGTGGWHEGELADPRTFATLERHEIRQKLIARQIRPEDFESFDLILASDQSNLRELHRRCPPEFRPKLSLVLDLVGGGEVPDPYYGDDTDFERVYALLDEALEAWLERWAAEIVK